METRFIKISGKKIISVKYAIIVVVIVGLLALFYFYKGLFIAATVNGSPISRWTVVSELEKQSGKMALDNLITKKLIDGEAKKRNISISKEDIDLAISNIESQLKTQNQTLDQALAARNMNKDDLIAQITTQKEMEKMLADKTQVSEEDINKFIKDNKVTIPAGKDADIRNQVKNQIQQQKFSSEANTFISGLRASASIKYFVSY